MATMHSKLQAQRSAIKFLLLEDEKLCHIFKVAEKKILKLANPIQPF